MAVGYVYRTTNNINGKKYIGLHVADSFDSTYFGSGKYITKAIKKYGKENFSCVVIEWCDTIDELKDREIYHILQEDAVNRLDYYNIINTKTPVMAGKNNPFYGKRHNTELQEQITKKIKGRKLAEETIQRMSIAQRKRWDITTEQGKSLRENLANKQTGRIKSEETRRKISENNKGRKLSEDAKRKISIANTGRLLGTKRSEESIEKGRLSQIGKKKTAEHVDKINRNPEKIRKTAEKHRGMKRSAEAKKRMSDARKMNPRPAWNKGIVCVHKGRKYMHNALGQITMIPADGNIPVGWKPGRGSRKN